MDDGHMLMHHGANRAATSASLCKTIRRHQTATCFETELAAIVPPLT